MLEASGKRQFGPFYALKAQVTKEIDDNKAWFRIEVDEQGTIQLFKAHIQDNTLSHISEWIPLENKQAPMTCFVFDPESNTRIFFVHDIKKHQLLKFDYNSMLKGPGRPFIFSQQGTPWQPDAKQKWVGNYWGAEYDLMALFESEDLNEDTKSQICEAVEKIQQQVNPEAVMDESSWKFQRSKPIDINIKAVEEIGSANRQLSPNQKYNVLTLLTHSLEPLKQQSTSKEEYLLAIRSVMSGDMQQLTDTSIETQANAVALRSTLFLSSINQLGMGFYSTDDKTGKETTISDVYLFYISILQTELRLHGDTTPASYHEPSEVANARVGELNQGENLALPGLNSEELKANEELWLALMHNRYEIKSGKRILTLVNAMLAKDFSHPTAINVASNILAIYQAQADDSQAAYDKLERDLLSLQKNLRKKIAEKYLESLLNKLDTNYSPLQLLNIINAILEGDTSLELYKKEVLPILSSCQDNGLADDEAGALALLKENIMGFRARIMVGYFRETYDGSSHNTSTHPIPMDNVLRKMKLDEKYLALAFEGMIGLIGSPYGGAAQNLMRLLFNFYFKETNMLLQIPDIRALNHLYGHVCRFEEKVRETQGFNCDYKLDMMAIIEYYGVERFHAEMVQNRNSPGANYLNYEPTFAGMQDWNDLRKFAQLDPYLRIRKERNTSEVNRLKSKNTYFGKIINDYHKFTEGKDTCVEKAEAILQNFIKSTATFGFFKTALRRNCDLNVVRNLFSVKDHYDRMDELLAPLTEGLNKMLPDEKLQDPEHPFIRRLQYVYALGGKELRKELGIELKYKEEIDREADKKFEPEFG